MVNFQIMSDLHIETLSDDISTEIFVKPSAEILILAGDIGRVHKYNQLENFLQQLCSQFQIVLYVLGNHEYYHVEGIEPKTMEEILSDIEKISSKIPNLYILNRTSVIIEDVCIVGATLFSQAVVNIPHYIVKIPNINTVKYNSLFKQDLHYIENMVIYCQRKRFKMLVVTHYAPTYLVEKKKKCNKYKSLYCSHLDYLLDKKKVHTWVYGHIHKNFDFKTVNGTRLVSNQRGKGKDLVPDFVLDKVITV